MQANAAFVSDTEVGRAFGNSRGGFDFITTFQVLKATGVTTPNQARFEQFSGDINLRYVPAFGTMKGTSGRLTVDATSLDQNRMTTQMLSGTVTVDGVPGSLAGLFGHARTVGAFHGNDPATGTAFSGGFDGEISDPADPRFR